MQGVVGKGGKAKAEQTLPKAHPRIANRSAADQTHRDKVANQWKGVEKPARRAYAAAGANRGVAATIPAYPRLTKASKISGNARFVRENVYDRVAQLRTTPTRGRNKLTSQQRAKAVADAVASARSLRARAAMTTPRKPTIRQRAAKPAGTVAKPRGLKPGAVTRSLARARPGQEQRAMQRAQANEKRLQDRARSGTALRTRAGVGYAVAKGAQGYYSGSMPRRKATFSPLTMSMDKKELAARRKRVVDNNKPQKSKGSAAKPQAPSRAASNPARISPKTNGRVAELTRFRNSHRKQLKEINQKIKEAGPNAGGLRLQKLKIQDRLNQLNTDLARVGATTAVRRTKKP